jgi:hypothetical protein
MLAIILVPLLLASPEPPSAEALAAEGEAYLKAAETAERPLDVLLSAHTSFDSAYLSGDDPGYLCRALNVTGRALQLPALADEQERKFWEETRGEDLERLQRDAAEKKRANCRFTAGGSPATPRVALIDADGPSPARHATPLPHAGEGSQEPSADGHGHQTPSRAEMRRRRAHTAVGAVLTGAGFGFLGALAGVLALERQRIGEMRGLVATAKAEGRQFTGDEDRRFWELRDEVSHGAGVAIGVGVAGLVTLGTGVAVLATRKKTRPRAYAFHPYGGPQGAGAVLRLRF